jgi:hypothetical protein
MTKRDIIELLAPFDDDDTLVFDGTTTWLGAPSVVCGKGQQYMPYYCVLKPGHAGQCFCACKHLNFDPDE